MRRIVTSLALVVAFSVPASFASAGVYTDDMSKCLVRSTTAEDQADLVAWVFVAMSAHPSVKGYVNLTEDQRLGKTKAASKLMERLMLTNCRKETVDALKYEGPLAIQQAFGVLGQVAMRGLMADPDVAKNFSALGEYVDEAKFEELGKEAGVSDLQGSPKKK